MPTEDSRTPDIGRDDPNELVAVTLRRGQWRVILAAASSYDHRVPLEQGDGGACLDTIREAIGDAR